MILSHSQKLQELKIIISEKVFVKNSIKQIDTHTNPDAWLFDFRRVLMNGRISDTISDIFLDIYMSQYPFQLCTLEIGGVPLVTSLMNKFFSRGKTDINAFFVRKSRKKKGLMQMIEGEPQEGIKVILVDDIMNSGNSFWRQIEALEAIGYKVDTVWSIIRFRDQEFYKRFANRGIKVESIFTLDDFTEQLGPTIKNLVNPATLSLPPKMPFTVKWLFCSENPSLNYVVSKSQPIIDKDNIYFGSDNETFWAINQTDGSVKWSFKVGPHSKKKSIFSNPVLSGDLVIFGSYDGNVYALDKETGKKVWISFEADWVGSSPAISVELGLVFIGLEFGLFKRHGGIVALDIKTGKTIWIDKSHHALTHASPVYIKLHEQVAIGSNEGIVRLYEARKGELLWKFTTFGGAEFDKESNAGFGAGEIKESIVYDEKRDYLVLGAMDGCLYILNRQNGHLVFHYKCQFGIWGTPYIFNDKVYFTSLDKHIRCLNLDTFELVFSINLDGTRIFSSPIVIDDSLYIGTNSARLHELDIETGKKKGYFQAIERVTNTVVMNPKTKQFFLPTYANEIICLKKE